MTTLFILAAVVLGLAAGATLLREFFLPDTESEKTKYTYKYKSSFLTYAEQECFNALMEAVGDTYLIFAQVHLSAIIDSKVVGQNWNAAFRHINGKSVDFVLCDKEKIAPKLAIELDDRSHERQDRKERDVEVERVLKDAGIPLLRLQNKGVFTGQELLQAINKSGIL